MAPAARSSLALAVLCLAAALYLSAGQTATTTIYDQAGLRTALADNNIGTIYFGNNIYVDPSTFGTDQVTISRAVTIRPTSNLASASWRSQTPPVLNISTVYRVFNVQPGAKVTFTLTELVHKDRGWPFSAFLSYPPSSATPAVVELVYAVNHIMQGPPLTIGSNYQYTPRPAAYPGTQQFYFIGDYWCLPFDSSRCYRQAALASDIAFTLPDMCNNWGFFTLRWSDVPIVLDAFLPDTCPPDTTPDQCVSSEMIKQRMTNSTSSGCDSTSTGK